MNLFVLFRRKPQPGAVKAATMSKVPWEQLEQLHPRELPAPSPEHAGPWATHGRGNGHTDVFDASGSNFAHVYCWDSADWTALAAAVGASEAWAVNNPSGSQTAAPSRGVAA